MLRFQRGEQEAFDELVRRNTPRIHGLVYRFLGGEQVEDLTQEIFLRIFRTAHRYQPTAKFSTWLYRITANLSFNVLRSRRKGRTFQLEVTSPDDDDSFYRDVPDESDSYPGIEMEQTELQQRIAEAIGDLPDNQRVAIVLNKYEEKSYEEIAQVLDCSTMAVKSLLSRARANLRDRLARYLFAD